MVGVLRKAAPAFAAGVAWAVLAAVMDRGLPLGIVVRGVVFGSLIALLAIGVVLVYRANRIVNFAQAELGAVAAVLAIEAKLIWGWNYFAAILMGFVVAALLGALIDKTVIRRFHTAPRLILTVATIGLAQILRAISIIIPILIGGVTAGRFETPFTVSFDVHPEVFGGNPGVSRRIYTLFREIIQFRRSVHPLPGMLERMITEENLVGDRELRRYLRDVRDHVIRIDEQVEGFRELLSSILNVNLTLVGIDQNHQVQKISAWAAILIVPTIIAGIYGMNFRYMPELDWTFGYPFALLLMVGVSVLLYAGFRRSGWL